MLIRTTPTLLVFGFILSLFFSSPASAIELKIRNNLPENDKGSVLEVERAVSKEAPKNKLHFKVLPGETKELTGGNIISFVLAWVFPRHKLKYEVLCEKESTGAAVITLQDVHDNKLPSACKVSRRGHWSRRSGMNWDL